MASRFQAGRCTADRALPQASRESAWRPSASEFVHKAPRVEERDQFSPDAIPLAERGRTDELLTGSALREGTPRSRESIFAHRPAQSCAKPLRPAVAICGVSVLADGLPYWLATAHEVPPTFVEH